jgi:crotonobetainyl-CoA:carnitine CoA-transferase CaiB-like acyl-CoA transferase
VSPVRLGNAHPNIAPYEVFPTHDGWFVLAVGNDEQFRRLWTLLGLAPDPRFATNEQRVGARKSLSRLIETGTVGWKRDELLARLHGLGVPAGPINSVGQAFGDPQVQHRRMQVCLQRADGSIVPGVRTPIMFSRSPLALGKASPLLGDPY